MKQEYSDFLRAKVALAESNGFDVDDVEIHPILKPHQRDSVKWAVRGGRRAFFMRFGLGKTVIQLETLRLVLLKSGGGQALIVCPLGVRQEFRRDAEMLGIQTAFVRTDAEASAAGASILVTNYESVREKKIDPRKFKALSLDEAAILRGFGGTKTFRELMGMFEGASTFRFVATATPSPNEFIELLAYAAFLDVMDVGQAKTRFFKRDATRADHLTIHPHKLKEFWLWVASWALFVQRPSDLGHSDEGYELPPLQVNWHEIPANYQDAGEERDGQGRLIPDTTISVQNAAREKKRSLEARISKLLDLRAEDPAAHRVLWHDLEAERLALEEALPSVRFDKWLEFKDGNAAALALYERHYSAYQYRDGRKRELFVGPGFKTVLLTERRDALFVWRKFIDGSGQVGVNCAVFRNEGTEQSSALIKEAMAVAWLRWPGERLYTYVNSEKVESINPGYCFQMAGWKKCGETDGGLLILEAHPGCEVPSVAATPVLATVYGSQDLDDRERLIIGFSDGSIPELAGKPVMLGSGTNMQRFCAWEIFLGIGFKFNEFIQAIHRCHRFLQTRPVRVDIIYTEAERKVRADLERKWAQHNQLVDEMSKIIREYGMAREALASTMRRSIGCERIEESGPGWKLVNNDSILEAEAMPADSVGLILTSIPFSNQYEYSPSYNDLGHNEDAAAFWRQMDYLTPNLLRVLQPGRVCAIHVKDRITPGGINGLGFQTVAPLHAEAIAHYTRHGFAYLGMKTITTDVVRENNQTYRLGWTEQCKDGSRMGCGMPEYLLMFRKPPSDPSDGYADVPVVKDKESFTLGRWQIDAHGYMRSSGDRLLQPADLVGAPHNVIYKMWRRECETQVYDFRRHVAFCDWLNAHNILPVTFMLIPPHSIHPDVWSNITRMRTLNGAQSAKGKEMHLCPMQFDIAERVITLHSMPGEVVFDPFAGLGTVPLEAVKQGRIGWGCELSPAYFADSVWYLRSAAAERATPTLFELLDAEVSA